MGYYSGFYSKSFWVEGVDSFEAGPGVSGFFVWPV